MKNSSIIYLFSTIILLYSCAQSSEQETSEVDNDVKAEPVQEILDIPATISFIETGNPEQWMADNRESAEHAGHTMTMIDVDNGNTLLRSHIQDANERTDAKEKLELKVTHLYKDALTQPFRVSIHLQVKDYKTWKWLFDGDEKSRKNAGMEIVLMGTRADDANDVFMIIAIPDIAKARSMMGNNNIKARMEQSGVIGEPEVRFWRIPE